MDEDELEDIANEMSEGGYQVFKVATKAIMEAFPGPGMVSQEEIVEGLEVALRICKKVLENMERIN